MERTYLFYDIETTGLNKAFDQVLQFAAIRTDTELNELERHEIIIDLNVDCVPTPQAMITHRIGLSELAEKGVSELAGIKKIHALLNTPGTKSVGYNTLRFDDEFLRFSFFRNLLAPYSHQYANNCSRFDILPMTIMYFLFKKDSLIWPTVDGKISLKLENINAANNFTSGNAHNAIVDVIATVELAKKLKKSESMWHYLIESFDKEVDHQRVAKLTSAFSIAHHQFKEAIMVDTSFGSTHDFQSVVLCLGRHNQYKNQSMWLRLDMNDFSDVTLDNFVEKTWVVTKKPGQAGICLPTIDRFMTYINAERRALINKNLDWIQNNISLFKEICRYHQEFTFPKIPNIDADAALYQMGFLLPHESQLCQTFHEVSNIEKTTIINQFSNPILREQAIRCLGRNIPESLTDEMQAEFDNYLNAINSYDEQFSPLDYKGQHRLTPRKALHETEKLLANPTELDNEQLKLLEELKSYLTTHFNIEQPEPA